MLQKTIQLFCFLPLLLAFFPGGNALYAQEQIEKYGIFELTLKGTGAGNPFVDLVLTSSFHHGDQTITPEGFYDGNGIYKIRFMPNQAGEWTYITKSNHPDLNNKKGSFTCIATGKNKGPVHVQDTYRFAYADSTAFVPFGTTIYEWAFQPAARQAETIATLKASPFNKARMLAVPPYKDNYVNGANKLTVFPFVGSSKADWDFSRFNPLFFQQLEENIRQLNGIGVQADLILFRPYDKGKWGFDMMNDETNERFIRYMMARFAAFQNIWWSMANENSFMKQLTDEDWDRYFQLVEKYDPYHHLRSIHNADRIYDYNKPWVTHVSLQYYNAVKVFGVSPLLRSIYKKPIVQDEINYEGDISSRWGQLSGEEMTRRFWIAYTGGAYATHGEALRGSDWISGGGKLAGSSPQRIAFLKKIGEEGPKDGLKPLDQYYLMNAAGKYGEYYLYYFSDEQPKTWSFELPDDELKKGMKFKADIIDTWNMTIQPVTQEIEIDSVGHYSAWDKKRTVIKLPGKPYMAIRLQRIDSTGTIKGVKKKNELTDEEQ
jgi:hypothetical protein